MAAVSLSIKNVPQPVVERLRDRAARNRRSLQGELLAIIEEAAEELPAVSARALFERAKALNLPAGERSVDIVREMRDERTSHLMQVLKRSRGRR
jgi:plasmid stability protein